MELLNEVQKAKKAGAMNTPVWKEVEEIYLLMLAPVAPHISEELWSKLGRAYSIHQQNWPRVDEAATAQDEYTLVIQVNGKVRDRIVVPVDITEEQAREVAMSSEAVQRYLQGKKPRQVIFVSGRLVNIVG